MTTDDGVVKLWRVGLLSALGLTLLVRSFSYEDWALLGHEVRGSFDLRLRAAGETAPPAAVLSTPQVDLSDIVRASPQPIWDPRVRWSVPYPLPNGTRLDRTVAGPNGTVVVFYGEPIPAPPEPPFVLCATGYVGPPTHRWMVGTFDASRRQVSAVALERVGSVDAAFVQPDGGIVVWGRLDQRGDGSADTVLFRIGLDGIDPTFQDLRRSSHFVTKRTGKRLCSRIYRCVSCSD